MRDILSAIAELGVSAKEENSLLVNLTKQAQTDARFTKILAFVALLYLPPSLIAVSNTANYHNFKIDTYLGGFQLQPGADSRGERYCRADTNGLGTAILDFPSAYNGINFNYHYCHSLVSEEDEGQRTHAISQSI